MGPQLDASHDMDNSEVHEITQIISALAQGGHTSEMAREAYEDIRNVIVETSQTYIKHLGEYHYGIPLNRQIKNKLNITY